MGRVKFCQGCVKCTEVKGSVMKSWQRIVEQGRFQGSQQPVEFSQARANFFGLGRIGYGREGCSRNIVEHTPQGIVIFTKSITIAARIENEGDKRFLDV